MVQQQPDFVRRPLHDSISAADVRRIYQEPSPYSKTQAIQPRMLYTLESQRLVGTQLPERELGVNVHRNPSPHLSHRHSERVLPSIEVASQNVRNQPVLLERRVEQEFSAFPHSNTLVRTRGPSPPVPRTDKHWDQTDPKWRRVEDFTSLPEEQSRLVNVAHEPQRTVLVAPSSQRENLLAGWQSTQSGHGSRRRLPDEREHVVLSRRIDITNGHDKQWPSHTTNSSHRGVHQQRYIVDAKSQHFAAGEHFQIQLSSARSREQTSLVSKPLPNQVDSRQSSPISHTFHKHVCRSHGPVNSYVSLPHGDQFNPSGDGRIEESTTHRTGSLHFERYEAARQVGRRDLDYRPERDEHLIEANDTGSLTRRAGYANMQYGKSRHSPAKLGPDHHEQWRLSHYDKLVSNLPSVQPHAETQDQSTRSVSPLRSKGNHPDVHFPQLPRPPRPDQRPSSQAAPKSQESQWYDLQRPRIHMDQYLIPHY